MANIIDKKPKIRYCEGLEEIKRLYLETLNFPNQEILAWESGKAYENFGEEFWDKIYIPKRIENKIWTRIIYSNLPIGRKHRELDSQSLRQIRIQNSNDFKIEIQIKLFGGKYSAFVSVDEMMGIIIESPKIYNTLKSIFETNWKSLE